jgi:hypothetical protein
MLRRFTGKITQSVRFRSWIRRVDWRVWAVIIAMVVSIIATVAIYLSNIDIDPVHKFGAAFAAWSGGVALFVVVGLAVAIVSLAQPEQESFDARARILFRRATGKHIDYVISRIKDTLEHYAEKAEIKIRIMDYNIPEKKYLVSISDTVFVRSYLDDVETSYASKLEYTEITDPPAGSTNSLRHLRVDGKNIAGPQEFRGSVHAPFQTRIDQDAACKVEFSVITGCGLTMRKILMNRFDTHSYLRLKSRT